MIINKIKFTTLFTIFCFYMIPIIGQEGKKSDKSKKLTIGTNLHDFMEDYTKPAMKYFKKTGDRVYLNQILKEVPSLALDSDKEAWAKIVRESLDKNEPESSCKTCHDLYKKDYKKKYRKREIEVPQSLVGLDKEISNRRKVKQLKE